MGIRVKRRELATSISNDSNSGFYVHPLSSAEPGLSINPGNGVMFPWLSAMAINYERYVIHNLSFEFLPAQATSTPGRIYVTVDYDWDDNVPTSKVLMMQAPEVAEAPVYQPFTLKLRPQLMNSDRFQRYVMAPGRMDPEMRLVHSGFIVIATDTTTLNCQWDIWVNYDISFMVPVADALIGTDNYTPTLPSAIAVSQVFSNVPINWAQPRNVWTEVVSGLVRPVIPGTKDVPPLVPNTFTNTLGLAYDVTRATRGLLQLINEVSISTSTPDQVMAQNTYMRLPAFDSAGTYVTDLYDKVFTKQVVGPNSLSELGTTNKPVCSLVDINLQSLKIAYPTIALLALYWYSSSYFAGASGALRTGYKYSPIFT